MKQFLLPASYSGQPTVIIQGEDYHYLVHVRRVQEHQVLSGIDLHGVSYELEVMEITGERILLKVRQLEKAPGGTVSRDTAALTLFQCIPKGKRMDTIIRQCVETGVSRIVPVISEHTVVKLTDEKRTGKVKRWEKIVKEAVQQSGNTRPLIISPVTNLADTLPFFKDFDLKLFFHEQPLANKGLHQYLFEDRKHIALFIGPEGGLGEKEVQFLRSGGFFPVWLGKRVLRVDTAALFAISSIQILLLEKDAWKKIGRYR
jgi:16S rRNA (uracil1498-N3)-methyltransferase